MKSTFILITTGIFSIIGVFGLPTNLGIRTPAAPWVTAPARPDGVHKSDNRIQSPSSFASLSEPALQPQPMRVMGTRMELRRARR